MTAHALPRLNFRQLTDGELILNAIGGREDGFEELVRRYQRPITGYVFRMLDDYESSLDVTQEVFIKVYNSLEQVQLRIQILDLAVSHRTQRGDRSHAAKFRESAEPRNRKCRRHVSMQIEAQILLPSRTGNEANGGQRSKQVVKRLPAAYKQLILLRHSRRI